MWAPELGAPGGEVTLPPDESHYVSRVCRARPGDPLHLTDGRGRIARGVLAAPGTTARVQIESLDEQPRDRALELWCGAPEGERADWLVEKLAELGVARLVLVDCDRCEWQRADARRERWERLAVAALRQSQQAWKLELAGPVPLTAALRDLSAGGLRVLARPGGGSLGPALAGAAGVVGAVGPSMGFAPGELDALLAAGFRPVALAPARLRTETAALALAAGWSSAMAARGVS